MIRLSWLSGYLMYIEDYYSIIYAGQQSFIPSHLVITLLPSPSSSSMELTEVPVALVARVCDQRPFYIHVLTTLIILCLTVAPIIIVIMDGIVVMHLLLHY